MIAHPTFRNLLARWRVEDKQDGFSVASKANWEQYMKVEQWVDVNFRIPDGMYHQEARLEAYKVRDEWFTKRTSEERLDSRPSATCCNAFV